MLRFSCLSVFLLLATIAHAGVGESAIQLADRYGPPKDTAATKISDKTSPLIENASHHTYEYQGWKIRAAFLHVGGPCVPPVIFAVEFKVGEETFHRGQVITPSYGQQVQNRAGQYRSRPDPRRTHVARRIPAKTAEFLETGYSADDSFVCEEYGGPEAARKIADHFHSIVEAIQRQVNEQAAGRVAVAAGLARPIISIG